MTHLGRGLRIALAGMALGGLAGCQESNEKTAQITSAPPPPGVKVPKTQEEQYQMQRDSMNQMQKSGYPGARR